MEPEFLPTRPRFGPFLAKFYCTCAETTRFVLVCPLRISCLQTANSQQMVHSVDLEFLRVGNCGI